VQPHERHRKGVSLALPSKDEVVAGDDAMQSAADKCNHRDGCFPLPTRSCP
jgi:hypothetical protein